MGLRPTFRKTTWRLRGVKLNRLELPSDLVRSGHGFISMSALDAESGHRLWVRSGRSQDFPLAALAVIVVAGK